MKVIKWLLYVIVGITGLVGATFIAVRFMDGPLGPIPGGSLEAGELHTSPVSDWTFAGAGTIELQLKNENRSRTTWMTTIGSDAYIPAAVSFPPNKQWHIRAEANGTAIIRVAAKRYPVTLRRVATGDVTFANVADVLEKDNAMPPGGVEDLWLFSVQTR